MSIKLIEKTFPEYFKNVIFPDGTIEQEIEVYRFCVEGKINRRAFDSSYADKHITKKNQSLTIREDSIDPKHYSTSVFYDFNDIIMLRAGFTKRKPNTLVAEGITEKNCGPCIISSKWRKCSSSHIDWWIYKDAHPEVFFKEVIFK